MESNWADQHLQTIRTLMERSAVYRRALAPVMVFAGTLGTLAAIAGLLFHLDTGKEFCGLWLGTALVVVGGSFFITRKQAFKDNEPFWSPPTRRVGQALSPPLIAGMLLVLFLNSMGAKSMILFSLIWALFYGCALHSAGFFMPRGMRLFGWIFIGLSCLGLLVLALLHRYFMVPQHKDILADMNAHWAMGFFFGVLHLVYGAYLYLTERGKNAP